MSKINNKRVKRKTTQLTWKAVKKNGTLYALLIIPVAYILLFAYYPMYGAQIAFRDYNIVKGIVGSPWVGLKHFRNFVNNYLFWRLMKNTLTLSLYSLATFPIPIVFAILIHNIPSKRFGKMVQMVTYAPYFISTVVMCGMILQFLAVRDGMVNTFLGLIGIGPIDFLGRPETFPSVYVWTGVWQNMGYGSVIYLSSLSSVDPELHEAAIIDGASLLKRIWYIDLPSISPVIITMFILNCGSILSTGYEKIMLLQNSLNITSSEVISTYVYKQGIESAIPQYSYASAIGLFVSVINMTLLVVFNSLSKRVTSTSLW